MSQSTPITRPISQKSLVLSALREAGERGICVSDVPRDLSYTLRNRVGELRREFTIESDRCRVHRHRSTVSRYVLKENTVQPVDRRPGNVPVARGGKKLRVSRPGLVAGEPWPVPAHCPIRSQTGELPVVGGLDSVLGLVTAPIQQAMTI